MTKLLTSDDLCHWGILGMKWGQRRYQYEDGTLTPEGIERYRKGKKELDNLGKAEERHKMRAAKADYIRATTKNVNKAVRKDKEQARENLRVATTRARIQKTIKSIENDLGKTMDELERDYGKDAILGDKHKKLIDDLIDRYSDTCAGEDHSEGVRATEEYLNELFPKSGESIKSIAERDKREENEQLNRDRTARNEAKEKIESVPYLKEMFDDDFEPDWKQELKNGKHFKEVATLGLKALRKMDGVTSNIEIDDGWREWFMYEDQTIAQPLIAHYMKSGKNAKQVKEFIDIVKNMPDDPDADYLHGRLPSEWYIKEGNWNNVLSKFADACEEVLEEEKKK